MTAAFAITSSTDDAPIDEASEVYGAYRYYAKHDGPTHDQPRYYRQCLETGREVRLPLSMAR